MTPSKPVLYRADVETHEEDEAETIRELKETFDIILERTSEDYEHAVRAVHAKAHGLLQGTLRIADGLPDELAQGLFARPGEHKVYLRMSTNAGDVLPDAISLPRGIAMKVCDVEGERLPDAEGTSQDFIMLNAPVFQAPSAAKFLGNLKMLARTTDRIEHTKIAVSKALQGVNKTLESADVDSSAVKSLGGAPNVDPLGETYYSATAFRYGDYIAKFRLRPVAAAQKELAGREIDIDGRENAIREEVRDEMARIDAGWAFSVQLCHDLDAQPVEDATVEWDEDAYPFKQVATLHVPSQDSWSSDRVDKVNEKMRFSVWTGIAAHQPLGRINRVRRDTYQHSADFRARFNQCPIHEPG